MRCARIKADGAGYYHCMSRIIERRMILEDNEKERLLKLMYALAAFGGLEMLAYAFLSNHFHILVHVPKRQEISDAELIRRLHFIYSGAEVDLIAKELADYRRQGQHVAAESLKNRFTCRRRSAAAGFPGARLSRSIARQE